MYWSTVRPSFNSANPSFAMAEMQLIAATVYNRYCSTISPMTTEKNMELDDQVTLSGPLVTHLLKRILMGSLGIAGSNLRPWNSSLETQANVTYLCLIDKVVASRLVIKFPI